MLSGHHIGKTSPCPLAKTYNLAKRLFGAATEASTAAVGAGKVPCPHARANTGYVPVLQKF